MSFVNLQELIKMPGLSSSPVADLSDGSPHAVGADRIDVVRQVGYFSVRVGVGRWGLAFPLVRFSDR